MNDNDDNKNISKMILGLSPAITDSIKASINAIDTIKYDTITSTIDNISVDSIASAEVSFNQLNIAQKAIDDLIISLNRMGAIPRIIDEITTASNIIENSINRIFPVSQIDIPDFSSQISSLLSNIDTSRSEDIRTLGPTLNQILINYQWFIHPRMPMPFVFGLLDLSKMDNPRQEINRLFFYFFSYNDYDELKRLVNRWELSGKFRPGRLKIIKDCLNAILTAKNGKIPSTLIIPTLIAQIDGIQTEFLLKNNFTISKTHFISKTGQKMWQKEAWNDTFSPEDIFSSITNDIILDVLFATAYPGESIKTPINFSRHKIMHGERLDYGTKYNVIRTFLILDFLNDLL